MICEGFTPRNTTTQVTNAFAASSNVHTHENAQSIYKYQVSLATQIEPVTLYRGIYQKDLFNSNNKSHTRREEKQNFI